MKRTVVCIGLEAGNGFPFRRNAGTRSNLNDVWVAIEAGALVSTIDGGRTWRDRVYQRHRDRTLRSGNSWRRVVRYTASPQHLRGLVLLQ